MLAPAGHLELPAPNIGAADATEMQADREVEPHRRVKRTRLR